MDGVNKTLYIPLYGKAYVSRRGLLLKDKKAEEIWEKEGFSLRGKAKSKWLAYNMAMRSTVFDRWLAQTMEQMPAAVILHVGCGMDSRIVRVGHREHLWYDIDFPEVIAQRKRYFAESSQYHMISSDIREEAWLSQIPSGNGAIIVMEGISMYLQMAQLQEALKRWKAYFGEVRILMDCYTNFGAKASKYKNPIHAVGVTQVYGFDDPGALEGSTGIAFCQEHDLTPQCLIEKLPKAEQGFFKTLFAGKAARKIYRLYEYR